MMFQSVILSSFALAAIASPAVLPRADASSSVRTATDALWDGHCFYPKADVCDFELEDYLGRWYEVASTRTGFAAGCECTFAEYSANENGTVGVFNSCRRGDQPVEVRGTATPAGSQYGEEGVFVVEFPGSDPEPCPGPNYVVQETLTCSWTGTEYQVNWAIVQSSNFSAVFVLSRDRDVPEASVEGWLKRAEALGADLSKVDRTNQTGCPTD